MAAPVVPRPETPVTKDLEFQPQWAVETVHGKVNTTPSFAYVDRLTRGRVYIQPNVQEVRSVGGLVDRRGGVIRAGIDSMELDVQNGLFLQRALRTVDGLVGSAWAANGRVPSMTMQAGATSDGAQLWGCVVDSLELTQSYTEDAEALRASLSILALGGKLLQTGLVKGSLPDPVLFGWQSTASLTTGRSPAPQYRIREWKIGLKNNHKYHTYGDLTAKDRGGAGTNTTASLREAYELKPGEEEVDFECQVEIPVLFDNTLKDDFTAACYTPGGVSANIVYKDCDGTTTRLTLALANLIAAHDQGFEFEYDAQSAAGEPVHVYSFKAIKANPLSASLTITPGA